MKRIVVVLAVVGAVSAGCSGAETDSTATEATDPPSQATTQTAEPTQTSEPSPSAEPEPEPEGTTIEISVTDLEFTPNGDSIDVPLGEEFDIVITADAPGELHMHSSPEQYIAYEGTGRPETFSFTIDRPGQVELESHDNGAPVATLVVS